MAVFQGAVLLSLDSKGRLAIPSKYREQLQLICSGRVVLTADVESCLLLYPEPEWLPIRDKLLKLSAFNPKIRALQRRLVGYAEDLSMDASGRILVSAVLREYAGLDKSVMLIGLGNKFELWDETKWQVLQQRTISFDEGELPDELANFSL